MLKEILMNYKPLNEQETTDKRMMLDFIQKNDNYLTRDNLAGHFTSSAIILNKSLDKILLIHHNIYNSWGWTGGHNDGDEDTLNVAIKEAKEETGLQNVEVIEDILGIDVVYVSNHIKRGIYVGDHLHMNITYLLLADENEKLTINPEENSGVQWFPLNEYLEHVEEPRMIPIYKKLVKNALNIMQKK